MSNRREEQICLERGTRRSISRSTCLAIRFDLIPISMFTAAYSLYRHLFFVILGTLRVPRRRCWAFSAFRVVGFEVSVARQSRRERDPEQVVETLSFCF